MLDKQNPQPENTLFESLQQYYQPVEMSEGFRRELLNKSRAVVAARRQKPIYRWVACLAGAAALIMALVLVRDLSPFTAPQGQGKIVRNQIQAGPAPMISDGSTSADPPQKTGQLTSPNTKTAPVNGGQATHAGTSTQQAAKSVPIPKATHDAAPLVAVIAATQPVSVGGRALALGDKLPVGAIITTGRNGRLTLVTRQGSELHLDANSALTLSTPTVATITRGRLYCSNHNKEFARIETPAGHVRLLGTVVDTDVVRQDAVAVTVVEGKVQLSNTHGNALVAAGSRAVLTADQQPQAGVPVNTAQETAWYHGRGNVQSDYGDLAFFVMPTGMYRQMSQRPGPLTEIWVMKWDGSDKHRVCSILGGGPVHVGDWMPGAQWVPVSLWTPSWQSPNSSFKPEFDTSIVGDTDWLINVQTGQSIPLPDGYWVFNQSFSPDATRIAFVGCYLKPGPSREKITGGLFVYDVMTAKLTCLAPGNLKTAPAWSPDSRYIAISTAQDYTNNHHLVIFDTTTGATRDLGINGAGASFSPDGRHLAYSGDFKQDNRSTGADGVPLSGSIFTLDLTTDAKPVRITPREEDAIQPRWSPDGMRLLYRAKSGYFVAQADGTSEKQIYVIDQNDHHSYVGSGSWAPTGDFVCLKRKYSNSPNYHILLIAADGSGIKEEHVIQAQDSDSTLSPAVVAQTNAAVTDADRAINLYADGCVKRFEGQFDASRAQFSAAARVYAQLVWAHPLSGMLTADTLRYADAAKKQASASDEDMAKECCRERMAQLSTELLARVQQDRGFPSSLSVLSNCFLTECPATQGQAALPFVYTPPKTPGVTPHIGDALVICPIDTSLNIVWTDKMENIMNQRLLSDSKSGVQWCLLQNDAYNLPYRFEKAGYDPTMLIYHLLQDKYEVHGSVRLLPTSKTYTNEEFQLHLGPSDEGSIARAIDALGTLDWGDLPKNEIDIATANLPFCRAVAQYEAGQPITGWDTIFIGEPAQPMCSWTGGGKGVSLGEVDDQLTQYTGCSDDIQVYRLEPSGRLRIDGTVKDEKTGQIYKNPIFDKDGKVNSSDK